MRRRIWPKILLICLILLGLLVIFWQWDWFIPTIESRASAALGRPVTLQRLQVSLGPTTTIIASGVTIANPPGFSKATPPLARVAQLRLRVNVMEYIEHRRLALTQIALEHPVVAVRQLANGASNASFRFKPTKGKMNPPELGELIINHGSASVLLPRFKTNFDLTVQTSPAAAKNRLFTGGEIVVGARGTYAGAPVSGRLIGGALLSLRNPSTPYPVDLHVQNGTSFASLVGSIKDPAHLSGAHLALTFSGQNMANLYQLTGVPIPSTPPFDLRGALTLSGGSFAFRHFRGRVGSSDLEGTIIETPGSPRRMITANLTSHSVNLADLAGFLGGSPGTEKTPDADADTRAAEARAAASPNLLPNKPINLPELDAANVDLHYRGEHIINRDVPFDDVVVHLTVQDGRITVDPLDFAVGTGRITSSFELDPVGGVLHTKANIAFRRLQLSRLMAATHAFAGNGTVGGGAYLSGSGNSVAQILGHGYGHASFYLQNGAHVSALLVDLAGLQIGDAVLSALGIPQKTSIHCLISDFALNNGQLDTKAFLLATKEANILGSGKVDLTTERLHLMLRTQATHFSIFSLSTPINIGGTLKKPSVLPAAGPLAARAVPAIALGILFPPLALIPTIRLGLGDKNACVDTLITLQKGHPHNPR